MRLPPGELTDKENDMRDYHRLAQEIRILEQRFGPEKVFWDRAGRWVMVQDFPLPRTVNRPATNVIVVIPEQYGNGAPLRDAFVDPDLEAYNPRTRRFEPIPHLFARYPYNVGLVLGSTEEWYQKRWQYICLHLGDGSLLTYLNNLYKYLNEPFRDWGALFASYQGEWT